MYILSLFQTLRLFTLPYSANSHNADGEKYEDGSKCFQQVREVLEEDDLEEDGDGDAARVVHERNHVRFLKLEGEYLAGLGHHPN